MITPEEIRDLTRHHSEDHPVKLWVETTSTPITGAFDDVNENALLLSGAKLDFAGELIELDRVVIALSEIVAVGAKGVMPTLTAPQLHILQHSRRVADPG